MFLPVFFLYEHIHLRAIFLLYYRELTEGIALFDDKNQPLNVQSKKAATEGISAVVLSRIGMAIPGMGKLLIMLSVGIELS